MSEPLIRAAMAVLLRCSLDEVDGYALDLVRADGRVTLPLLTPEQRREALGGIEPYAVWRDGKDTFIQVHPE